MEPEAPSQGATFEFCYRHPKEATGVHCTRCGRPICPDCMIPAPVGYQCPECVAEARKAFRQSPTQVVRAASRASMTKITLVVLAAVYVAQLISGHGFDLGLGGKIDPLLVRGAMIPTAIPPLGVEGVANGEYYRLFTAMFLHWSVLHILMNCWVLWVFGQSVENTLGRWAFVIVYLVGGFMGSVASYVFGPAVQISAGASGAIVGLFGAFIAYNFRRRENPGARAALQSALVVVVLNALLTIGYRGIDWRAHLGGLVGGFAVGWAIDWMGPRRSRLGLAAASIAAVVAVGAVLVGIRTAQLHGAG